MFSNLCHKIIDPITLNISIKLAHDTVPVAYRLFLWNFRNILPFCKNCMQRRKEETVTHCFWECPTVQSAKLWLQKALKILCNFDVLVEIVRFGNLPNTIPRPDFTIILLTEYRYAVWISRCRVRIDNSTPHTEIVLKSLLSRINNRIIIDKYRLSLIDFTN